MKCKSTNALFAVYATDGQTRQTDGRTEGQKKSLLPLPYAVRAGEANVYSTYYVCGTGTGTRTGVDDDKKVLTERL